MNFIDRTALGDILAPQLEHFHGKDAIVLCLQESALMTSLTIATSVRAWLYPLVYAPVYTPDDAKTLIGAYDQDGTFCPAAGVIGDDAIELSDEYQKIVDKQKNSAMRSIKSQASHYDMDLNKHQLSGRDVIMVGDVITSSLPILVARNFLHSASPRSLAAAIGNVTPDVAQLIRASVGEAHLADVVSGIYFDTDHYFEHEDSYTMEEKRTLAQHIATYWH